MGKKKKFIDKKNALNFEVVHRDQRDPLTADENAPQMLLKQVDLRQKKTVKFDIEDPEERRRAEYRAMKAALRNDDYELGAYAFPQDGYDYSQHLREGGGGHYVPAAVPKPGKQMGKLEDTILKPDEDGAAGEETDEKVLMLPASMFATSTEMSAPVGTLRNRPEFNGLDLSLDPEIMAALDGAEGFEELADDFVFDAQEEGEFYDDEEGDMFDLTDCFGNAIQLQRDEPQYGSDEYCSDISGEAYSDEDDLSDCETAFTMTTSRRERGEQGRTLDDRFEQLLKDEYDDDEVGELEEEDAMIGAEPVMSLEGNSALEAILDEYIENSGDLELAAVGLDKKGKNLSEAELQKLEEANNQESRVKMGGKEPERQEEWDCETIVSTYSNIYNHPKALDQPRIQISKKTGVALGYLPSSMYKKQESTLDEEEEEEDEEGEDEVVNLGAKRRGETKEEKKARKAALKDLKRVRREHKKELKNEFKKESELQKKEAVARGPRLRIKPIY